MFKKALLSVLVAVVAILVCVLLGALLQIIEQETIKQLGKWLKEFAGLIGIACGIAYFVWGVVPDWKRP